MRKQQEEGFAGGLQARNAPGFTLPDLPTTSMHGVSRVVAVDNLWIIMGFIYMPQKRV